MVGVVNRISFVSPSVPVLTNDDSEVAYCNEHSKPDSCQGSDNLNCHCTHLVELELCEVYEFIIRDNRSILFALIHPIQ